MDLDDDEAKRFQAHDRGANNGGANIHQQICESFVKMFGTATSSAFGAVNRPSGLFGNTGQSSNTLGSTISSAVDLQNPNNDVEVPQPPEDTVQALKFNPVVSGMPILLAAGSWDNACRVWQVQENGTVEPKAVQNIGAAILSIDWVDDGTPIKWLLWGNMMNQCAAVIGGGFQLQLLDDWIVGPHSSLLDMRQLPTQNSLATIQLPERVYCSDVLFPMAVVGLANRHMKLYNLDGQPQEISDIESPLKFQSKCVSIFQNKLNNRPHGYALGSIEGRVAVQYVETANPKDNFTFKCHRSPDLIQNYQEIYPVNDVAFHPLHNTLATVGGDGRYSFWDKDARTKLKSSEAMKMPITKCHIHASGNIFAYATGYDWSRGHEASVSGSGSKIFLHACAEDMKGRPKK
uniref:Uncharacterized protein n=1 Tax=Ditylenchus dipsaci TaxID=166011 RepID=A0A915EMA5_9BILA